MTEQKLHTRVRDTVSYRKANMALVQSVDKKIFKIDWDLNFLEF